MQDFVASNFDEWSKSTREKLHSKLGEEKSLRKDAEFFYTFLLTPEKLKNMSS